VSAVKSASCALLVYQLLTAWYSISLSLSLLWLAVVGASQDSGSEATTNHSLLLLAGATAVAKLATRVGRQQKQPPAAIVEETR
jgi:hypothetical protein